MKQPRHRPGTITAVALIVTTLWAPAAVATEPRGPLAATLMPARNPVYVGEVFDLYLEVYSDGPRISQEMTLDRLPDLSVLQLNSFSRELQLRPDTIGNRRQIRRHRVKAKAFKPGTLALSPVLKCTLVQRTRSGFFTSQILRQATIPVISTPIIVRPLPQAGRPADYSGLIATQALFDVHLSSQDVSVGDLITLTLSVRSHVELIEFPAPVLNPGSEFKAYPTKQLPDQPPTERRFKKIIIPLSTNATELPSVRFSYFKTPRGEYETITRGPFSLLFHEPEELVRTAPAIRLPRLSSDEDAADVFVKTVPRPAPKQWSRIDTPPYRRTSFWLIQLCPLLLAAGLRHVGRHSARRSVGASLILVLLGISTVARSDPGAAFSANDAFARGLKAQQAENYAEAITEYQSIRNAGYESPELHHNLGSAYYEDGQIGQALLHYSRAQRMSPRNPELRRNLARAQSAAGVSGHATIDPTTPWRRVTATEWTSGAVAFYWLACIAAGLYTMRTRLRAWILPALCASLIGCGFSIIGVTRWETVSRREAIVLSETEARFGPMLGARKQFHLRPGAMIRILSWHEQWAKIESAGRRGWIADSTAEQIDR